MLGTKLLTADEIVDVESSGKSKHMKLKTGRSESEKLFKYQKSAKLGKKLSKVRIHLILSLKITRQVS